MEGIFQKSLVTRTKRGLALTLPLAVFLCQIEIPSAGRSPSNLAPKSFRSFERNGGIDWFHFAQNHPRRSRIRPTHEEIHAEWKQLGKTFVLEESGEERLQMRDLKRADRSKIEGNLYLISDVHLSGAAAGGMEPWKYKQLLQFLNAVIRNDGNLVINGDFLELYINKKFLYEHLETIYRKLRRIKRVFYLVGNHDQELTALIGKRWKNISFLDAMSIETKGELIRIEHGHQSDFPIHDNGRGGIVIRFVHWMEDHGIPIRLYYARIISWVFFFVLPLQFLQLYYLHKRILILRSQLELKKSRYPWPVDMLWDLLAKKDEPILNYVFGHHHEMDLWIFEGFFFRVTNRFRTRVKLHFTAGRWEQIPIWQPLLYTHIDTQGRIERRKVEDLVRGLQGEPPLKPDLPDLSFSNTLRMNFTDEILFGASL